MFPSRSAEKHPMRTGTVVYTHPKGRFVTVAFEEADGKVWLRESFHPSEVQIIRKGRR